MHYVSHFSNKRIFQTNDTRRGSVSAQAQAADKAQLMFIVKLISERHLSAEQFDAEVVSAFKVRCAPRQHAHMPLLAMFCDLPLLAMWRIMTLDNELRPQANHALADGQRVAICYPLGQCDPLPIGLHECTDRSALLARQASRFHPGLPPDTANLMYHEFVYMPQELAQSWQLT